MNTDPTANGKQPASTNPFSGLIPVLRKEAIHIRRDATALFFTVVMPMIQMFLIGFAINTNVRRIPTAVYDAAQTQESRRLLDRFVNSDDFKIVKYVDSEEQLNREVISGRARVGVKIPPEYSRRLLAGESASYLVLVDGSDSSVAGEALNVSNAIALRESLERSLTVTSVRQTLPVESRPKVLFNPDSKSANFLIPGMIAVLMQMMTVLMTAITIVRERERGTLDQLYMTPVKPLGLMVGKVLPYAVVAYAELCLLLLFMRWAFGVPIRGSIPLLLLLVAPFILTMLGFGLLVSTKAQTYQEATQMAFGTMMPSIFLSGYIFPIDTMPTFFQVVSSIIPTTYLIQIFRGVILRGAELQDLWKQALILSGMSVFMIVVAARRFRKKSG
ncbi:MAG TPA: ABC transporter permease [Blastocatellia bacterium]|nr:ABC transporter permease [Blastocatellia bacterium]HMX27974.1 ABC transporter permease [Blastocatellia bacterium]HMY72416.1 ABC transporter permease [Blastocatellia bacterium]HMZ23210.1 ABC transporter permease [Blastocatellia bacterium]HNG34012.1 ABC transporter permease [Blastocatellia bacterium]